MYYAIRSTGPKTKKELLQYYITTMSHILKLMLALAILVFTVIAGLTKNLGAVAVIILTSLLLGSAFDFLHMKRWVPGLKQGSWFVRSLLLSLYVFLALGILLVANPSHL